MANSLTTQILEDGERNVVVNVVGILDTSDLTAQDILDPTTLLQGVPPANRLAIMKVEFAIEGTLSLRLLFDATADVVALTMNGFNKLNFENVGGIPNNAGAGVTGKIQLTTEGWSAAAVLHFTFKLKCKKYTV